MTVVRLTGTSANRVLEIVYELRSSGLSQGTDFDFVFHPGRWDNMTGDIEKYVEFKFYDSKNATWFRLKHT